MSRTKTLTVRLSEREFDALSGFSVIENQPISAIIRAAVGEHIRNSVADTAEYERKTAEAVERAEKARRELLDLIGVEPSEPIRPLL